MVVTLKEDQRFLKKLEKTKKQGNKFKFLQLGCGSGAIGLSLAKYFQKSSIPFYAEMIDIDPRAVKLSSFNMKKNNLDKQHILIKEGDMIQLMESDEGAKYFQQFDLIISNPPYISVQEYNKELQRQVKRFESKLALVGDQKVNENGLFYLEKIIETAKKCKQQKRPIVVVQFGGQSLQHLGSEVQKGVLKDYYEKRRFLFWFG